MAANAPFKHTQLHDTPLPVERRIGMADPVCCFDCIRRELQAL